MSPCEPGTESRYVPGTMAMNETCAVPAASNSIECTPIGRTSMSLMTISFTQIDRKKSPPDSAISAVPSATMSIR